MWSWILFLLYLQIENAALKGEPTYFSEDDLVPGTCSLPRDLDYLGKITYLEDCDTLEQFRIIPIPPYGYYGVQPKVCCPKLKEDYEEWTGNITQLIQIIKEREGAAAEMMKDNVDDDDDDDDDVYEYDYDQEEALFSDTDLNCKHYNQTICTPVSRCDIFDDVDPTNIGSISAVCSFDQDVYQIMLCCPKDRIRSIPVPTPLPRFPVNSVPRDCEDRSSHCGRWKSNDACSFNKTFLASEHAKIFTITSAEMFKFTSQVCLKSCHHCGYKGCVDELPQCHEWARKGLCISDLGYFMSHTCRESCGVCGFLSSFSTEEQKTADGKSYSNLNAKDFDCGRYKTVKEVNSILRDLQSSEDSKISEDESNDNLPAGERAVRQAEEDIDNILCGATLISDRWMMTAAHCFPLRSSGNNVLAQNIRTLFPSFLETIEVRNVYVHPDFKSGMQYGDVALLELGRRVLYDFDQFGDTPTCLDNGIELEGKLSTIQGFGENEFGTKRKLLEGNTTLIHNDDCMIQIDEYLSKDEKEHLKKEFCSKFPFGLTEQHICGKGELFDFQGDKYQVGPCRGDNGGPVFIKDSQGKQIMAGIIGSYLPCFTTAPVPYTRFIAYRDWVTCIMAENQAGNLNKAKVERVCNEKIRAKINKPVPMCADTNTQ